jgi:hypothetical protein
VIEPIDLILRALEEGNTPDIGIEAMIPDDIMDNYGYFTDLVAQLLQNVGGERLLENYMGQPDLWADTLAKALEDAGADKDDALLEAARRTFMSGMNVRRAVRSDYTIDLDDEEMID